MGRSHFAATRDWRKVAGDSSLLLTHVDGVAAEDEARPSRFSCIALLCIALLSAGSAAADNAAGEQDRQSDRVIRFDIPQQRADQALIEFAEQADVTFIFPVDQARKVTSNAVRGEFTREEAIGKLLADTGLEPSFQAGALTVNANHKSADKGDTVKKRGVFASIIAVLTGSAGVGAHAADTGEATIDEVIVTAQKREQRLQDVPLSIGVVTAVEIEKRGLVGAGDYLRGMPGASQSENAPAQSIVIRGLEANTLFQGARGGETTGTYFGEIPLTGSGGNLGANVDVKLVDVERVEVLRGPQGTAFGSSSLGGTVRIVPVAPNLERFEGKLAAGYSVTSGAGAENDNFSAVANFPLVRDKLAVRAAAYSFSDSGFYVNRAQSNAGFFSNVVVPLGAQAFATDDDEVGNYYVQGARLSALFQATDRLSFTLSYLTQKNETDGIPVATSGSYEQSVLRVASADVRRGQGLGGADSRVDAANATMSYEFGWGDLLATYSHRESEAAYSRPWTSIGLMQATSQLFTSKPNANFAEVRFASKLDGPWDFLVGAYYEDRKSIEYVDQTNIITDVPASVSASLLKSEQAAAFGEVTWEFIPRWTVAAGVRAFQNKRSGPFSVAGFTPQIPLESFKESDQVFRAALSFKPTDAALIYANWSQGFRPGRSGAGLSVPPGASNPCDPNDDGIVDGTNVTIKSTKVVNADSVDNYEIGTKFRAFNRLTVDAAVFVMDWSGVPVTNILANPAVPSCLGGYITNAGTARSEGLELQASFQATDSVRVDLGGSRIKARITDGNSSDFPEGNLLPGAPKTNANLSVQYDFSVLGRSAFIRTDAIYVGAFYGNLQNTPITKSDDYVKIDLTTRVMFDSLSVDIFAKNITNEDVYTSRGAYAFVSGPYGYQMRPRTIGMQLAYSF